VPPRRADRAAVDLMFAGQTAHGLANKKRVRAPTRISTVARVAPRPRVAITLWNMPFSDERLQVAVIDYRPSWTAEFNTLAAALHEALGDSADGIDHVGSTSVPGLPAKDCIDVQVRVTSLDEARIAARFEAIGFRRRPEPWNRSELSSGKEYRKLVFAPPVGARSCNIHVREGGGGNARYALLFRDFLRADDGARKAWGAFKQRLAISAPDLMDYGQIKAPATDILMAAAERWATDIGWIAP
jgi:GrpB-like predicted nucleotidyltransferase (UPF0157 family)